jgi:MFS family permease
LVPETGEEIPPVDEPGAGGMVPPESIETRTLFHGGVLSALRHRDYTLLLSGSFLSNVGTWIYNTILFWYVKDLTGSDAWVGALNLANFLPILIFVLLAGSLADTLNRKRLILVTQVLMMLAALAMAICTQFGVATLPVILVITVVMGVSFTFTFPAYRSVITDLVPTADMQNAIALDAAQFNLTRCVGPVLAIVVYGVWSAQTAFGINAASFLAVILALLFIRTKTPGMPPPPEGRSQHIYEGIKYALGNRWSRNLLIVLGIWSFFGASFIVLLPGIAMDVLHMGKGGYGLLLGFFGLGAVIGAPLVTLLGRYFRERDIIRYSLLGFGWLMVVMSFCRVLWACLLSTLGLGICSLMLSATVNAVLQSRVGRDMRGRIMSFYIMVLQGVLSLGGLAMGFLSVHKSAPFTILMAGIVCVGAGVIVIMVPSILREAVFSGTPPSIPYDL